MSLGMLKSCRALLCLEGSSVPLSEKPPVSFYCFLQGVFHCAVETAKLGPQAFFKGLVPAGVRLIPHTVLTFMFLEQLRKHFGIKVAT